MAGVLSQGRTGGPRENAIDTPHGIPGLRFGEHALTAVPADSESLELLIAA